MTAKTSLLLAVGILLSACVTTNATLMAPAGNQGRPRVSAADIILYTSPDRVPGAYEEVAILHSSGESAYSDEAAMYESMKIKAAELGANAIILGDIKEPSAGAKVAAALFMPLGTGAVRTGKAVAIYVDSPEFRKDRDHRFAGSTMSAMAVLASAISMHVQKGGEVKKGSTLQQLYPKLHRERSDVRLVDAWGTPYYFDVYADGYRIVSAGADREFQPSTWTEADKAIDANGDAVMVVRGGVGDLIREWGR